MPYLKFYHLAFPKDIGKISIRDDDLTILESLLNHQISEMFYDMAKPYLENLPAIIIAILYRADNDLKLQTIGRMLKDAKRISFYEGRTRPITLDEKMAFIEAIAIFVANIPLSTSEQIESNWRAGLRNLNVEIFQKILSFSFSREEVEEIRKINSLLTDNMDFAYSNDTNMFSLNFNLQGYVTDNLCYLIQEGKVMIENQVDLSQIRGLRIIDEDRVRKAFNSSNNYGSLPLASMIEGNLQSAANWMIRNGASLTATSSYGISPLLVAALLENGRPFLEGFFPSEEEKREAAEVAAAITYLRLNYSDETYPTYNQAVRNLTVKTISETEFPPQHTEAGRCLAQASRIIQEGGEFTKTLNINGKNIKQKFRIVKDFYKGHCAYLIIKYQKNNPARDFFPIEVSYIDGNCPVDTRPGKRGSGERVFIVDPTKIRTFATPALFEERLFKIFSGKKGNESMQALENFALEIAKQEPNGTTNARGRLFTHKQKRGNCTSKNTHLAIISVACEVLQDPAPEDVLRSQFSHLFYATEVYKENIIRSAHKFQKNSAIARYIGTLVRFATRKQNLREESLAAGLDYKEHPFFNQALEALQKSVTKFSLKMTREEEAKEYSALETSKARVEKANDHNFFSYALETLQKTFTRFTLNTTTEEMAKESDPIEALKSNFDRVIEVIVREKDFAADREYEREYERECFAASIAAEEEESKLELPSPHPEEVKHREALSIGAIISAHKGSN